MSKTGIVLNYDDYAALPADGRRYELHEGELSVAPAPTPRHQMILANLFDILHAHVQALVGWRLARVCRRRGERLSPPGATTIVQPDLVYLGQTRLTAVTDRAIEGAPTLVVGVLSPSTGGGTARGGGARLTSCAPGR